MIAQYAGALLYLVPVALAAIVAYLVSQSRPATSPAARAPAPPPPVPGLGYPPITRMPPHPRSVPAPSRPHPTLLHAALSAHLDAVARAVPSGTGAVAARSARLVSIRRPTPIPRRPSHRCPRER